MLMYTAVEESLSGNILKVCLRKNHNDIPSQKCYDILISY